MSSLSKRAGLPATTLIKINNPQIFLRQGAFEWYELF